MSDEDQLPRANGRFVKGRSYNPGGRPKGSKTFVQSLMNHVATIDPETGLTELDQIIINLVESAKRRTRLGVEATKVVAAYLDGLPFRQDEDTGLPVQGGRGVVLLIPTNGRELPIIDEDSILQANVVNGRVSVAFPAFDDDAEEN